jgi:hypothetical protein
VIGVTSSGSSDLACFSPTTLYAASDIDAVTGIITSITAKN